MCLQASDVSARSNNSASGSGRSGGVEEALRLLEAEIAGEDPFCGEIVVRNIAKSFILPDERDLLHSWEL